MRLEYCDPGLPGAESGSAGATLVTPVPKATAGAVPLAPDVVDVEVVNAALAQVMASGRLKSAVQLRRFLAFVVEESLAGRGDKLKAYTIATRALGRPSDFDPGKDPIVRVEATRLRAALTAYYADDGRDTPIRFHMLPGSYRPLIELRDTPSIVVAEVPAPSEAAASPEPPAPLAPQMSAKSERLLVWMAGAALVWSLVNTALVGYSIYTLNEHRANHPTADIRGALPGAPRAVAAVAVPGQVSPLSR